MSRFVQFEYIQIILRMVNEDQGQSPLQTWKGISTDATAIYKVSSFYAFWFITTCLNILLFQFTVRLNIQNLTSFTNYEGIYYNALMVF